MNNDWERKRKSGFLLSVISVDKYMPQLEAKYRTKTEKRMKMLHVTIHDLGNEAIVNRKWKLSEKNVVYNFKES